VEITAIDISGINYGKYCFSLTEIKQYNKTITTKTRMTFGSQISNYNFGRKMI